MARTRYQKAKVFKRNGNWVGRYRESVDENGVEVRIRKRVILGRVKDITEKQAFRVLEPILARINSLDYRPSRVANLQEFCERWRREVLSKRKPSTIHAAESHLKVQILPSLGHLGLAEISPEVQQRFITKIEAGISRKMVLNVLGTLSSLLKTAGHWGYHAEKIDFSKLVLPPRGPKTEAPHYTPELMAKVLSLAEGQYHAMFAIAALTALRVGEILALQWGDFDFTNQRLFVRRSTWRCHVTTPKTGERCVTLPQHLIGILHHYRNEWKPNVGQWLFLNTRGHLFISENINRQALHPILATLGLPKCGFHAFRHTLGSMLAMKGKILEAQRQLGHQDIKTTLNIYGHLLTDTRIELDAIGEILVPKWSQAALTPIKNQSLTKK